MRYEVILVLILWMAGCRGQEAEQQVSRPESAPKKQRPLAFENGKFFDRAGRRMLYGGEGGDQHFEVSNLSLQEDQFHYGIGREKFPALLEPNFISVQSADTIWPDTARFLVAHAGKDVKAYSVKDLTRHEVVNDVLDGKPIMAVYCILADLGAIYRRDYGAHNLTFALSGYTYFDPMVWNGLDGFVLWDRDTESLWWPLTGEAVSGPLKGAKLREVDQSKWADITWGDVKSRYPNAQVLESGQDYERPGEWVKIEQVASIIEASR